MNLNEIKKYIPGTAGLLFVSALFSACGGSSGNGGATNLNDDGTNDEATFSLGITDGPVDTAEQVVVQFDGVELQPASGDRITFDFATPQSIDLLALQGNNSEMLLMNETIPAGEYSWVRLMVSAEQDGVMDSYLVDTSFVEHELWIPSGAETGLKLVSGFTAAADSVVDFTIDFDLRKSVTFPPGLGGTYMLRPALRLVDNLTVGTVAGNIDAALIETACGETAENNGSVYLYSGTVEVAEDISGADTDPLATATVDDEGGYEIGFIMQGQYSAAYTCDSAQDDPQADDELSFYGLKTLEVSADTTTEVDFTATDTIE